MDGDLSSEQYRDLAEFRRQIRRYIHFAETAARDVGIEPQQNQLMLALYGLPEDVKPTVGELAARMFLQPNSTGELINRLEQRGFVTRRAGDEDRREVLIRLTPLGRSTMRKLAVLHRDELDRSGPELARALAVLLRHRRHSRGEGAHA